jgi:alkylation response protein AidB-like acyl-CoA dehydrogenase
MANFYTDSAEWQYLFKNGIDWDRILPLYIKEYPTPEGFQNKEEVIAFYEELLTNTGKWAADTLYPRARELDRMGGGKLRPDGSVEISEVLQKTYREATEMGVHGLAMPAEFGGLGIPVSAGLMAFEQVSRACVATSSQLGFFSSIADMIERFCSKELQDKFIPKIISGEISGSMCLTEPDCGSDLSAIRTSAEKQADGTYLLNGSKRFITNAGGGLAFILARVKGAPAGLEGLSLFFAEEWIGQKHNYVITKIEEKMGMHGSPTCEVVYDNTIAHLVGNEGDGFKHMLHLMNEARISVGLQGLGGIEQSLHIAREYCESRKAFGKPVTELPLMKRNFRDWETERDAIRALMVDTVSWFDIFQRLDLKKRHAQELTAEESALFSKAKSITRLRTPLVKFYGAEAYATLSTKGLQAHGGYGFIQEYEAERIHRDSFCVLLYEGTSQIQSLMAMKDFVKGMITNPGRFVQTLVTGHPISSLLEDNEFTRSITSVRYEFRKNAAGLVMRCFRPDLGTSEKGLSETIGQIRSVFRREYWQEANRFDRLMEHAETLCAALSYVETLRVLAKHAEKDSARGDLYHRYLKLVTPRLQSIYGEWRLA